MSDVQAALAAVAEARAAGRLSEAAEGHLARWLTAEPFAPWRDEVAAAVAAGDWETLEDSFRQVIPFGTAGRRGAEGLGPNRINARTIAESAAGLADYVRRQVDRVAPIVVIAYDNRRNSAAYGRLCAEVMAARGCEVFLFEAERATPMLAYTVLDKSAHCGIMITASHNPPPDNGFKAYWRSGGQVCPPHDAGIIDCVNQLAEQAIDREPLEAAIAEGRVVMLGREADSRYWDYVANQTIGRQRAVRLVYSPLQGTGGRCVLPVLERAGFTDVRVVESQANPSSEFENVTHQVANPELPEALDRVIELCREVDADAGIASDPDADRIGFVARDETVEGGYRFFNGNQLGCLVAAFACEALAADGLLRPESVIAKSVVTSELVARVAEAHRVKVRGDLPVGFRWVGELLDQVVDADDLVVAIEESHGLNRGGLVRDKDAASAALALAELTARLTAEGRTVSAYLDDLYRRYGYHAELLHNVAEPRRETIDALIAGLRERPPSCLGGLPVEAVEDRGRGDWVNPVTGRPVFENCLIWRLGGDATVDGVKVAIRPSGTEPKMKIYVQGWRAVGQEDLAAVKAAVDARLASLPTELLAAARGEG